MRGSRAYKRKLRSGKTTWCVSVDLAPGPDGKRRRVFKSGFETQELANKHLTKLNTQKYDGKLVPTGKLPVAEVFDRWFKDHARLKVSPKTLERYIELAGHVTRRVGHLKIEKLRPLQLQRVFNELLESGKKNGSGFSTKTVKHVADLVRTVFNKAIDWELMADNPALKCELPSIPRREAKFMDAAGSQTFMSAAAGTLYRDVFAICFATGCRRGEALALRWSDLDPAGKILTIRQSLEETKAGGLRAKAPKNGKARPVILPDSAAELLRVLKSRQDAIREMVGGDYVDNNLIFCDPTGKYLTPHAVSNAARRIAQKAGLKGISLHSTRHSHASLLLSEGTPIAAVSKRLGHSSTTITQKIYEHALAHDELAAAKIWERAMGSVMEEVRPQLKPSKTGRVVSISGEAKTA